MEVEAVALLLACKAAQSLDIHKSVFESDCKVLIDAIQQKGICPWYIHPFVSDSRVLLSNNPEWSLKWINSSRNVVAHELAKWAFY